MQKAQFIFEKYNVNCFADDTGLLVDALDGERDPVSRRHRGMPWADEREGAHAGDEVIIDRWRNAGEGAAWTTAKTRKLDLEIDPGATSPRCSGNKPSRARTQSGRLDGGGRVASGCQAVDAHARRFSLWVCAGRRTRPRRAPPR